MENVIFTLVSIHAAPNITHYNFSWNKVALLLHVDF